MSEPSPAPTEANNQAQLTLLCERLGAEPQQALVMARQLLKRSRQMSAERGASEAACLEYLLQVMIAGRNGVAYEGEPPGSSPSAESTKSSEADS